MQMIDLVKDLQQSFVSQQYSSNRELSIRSKDSRTLP